MALNTAVRSTTGVMAAASCSAAPTIAILMTMKMRPETAVVTKVATAVTGTLTEPFLEATPTMPAMSMAATPSAAKSMKGEVVVSWMTAAEMRPTTRAWPMLGRTTRIVRQKAEMMNSGLIMPPEMDEMALPTVKLRMKPAASRMASSTSAWRSSLPRLLVVTVRACWVFSDMVVNLSVVPGWSSGLLAMWVGASRTLPRYEKRAPGRTGSPFIREI